MNGKREILADVLFHTRLVALFRRYVPSNKLVILNYHRVRSRSDRQASLFDDELFVDESVFLRQMRWIKRHARILSETDILDLTGRADWGRSDRPRVAITFDDGYSDNYAVAYAILRSLDIPAIFFVCTEMIREQRLRWWDVLAYLIKQSTQSRIAVHGREYDLRGDRLAVIRAFKAEMIRSSHAQNQGTLHAISEACRVLPPPDGLQRREIMDEEQIREMAMHRMAIGSHTDTHQALSSCEKEAHCRELTVSKQYLERVTGQPVRSISYPYGLYEYIPDSVQESAGGCGYELGFTSNFGVNYAGRMNRMALRRFSGDLDKASKASLLIVWPELFAD